MIRDFGSREKTEVIDLYTLTITSNYKAKLDRNIRINLKIHYGRSGRRFLS